MIQIILMGLGAGATAALLFASIASGSIAAIFLFYLAPLPIMIVTLGWSQLAGLTAAATATIAIASLSGVFLVAVGVIAFGAWWLGYLALLARPATNGAGSGLRWYPVGRLIIWAAALATLLVAAAVPNFGTDQQSVHAGLRAVYGRIVRDQATLDLLVTAVPLAAAMFSTITGLFNLWLAARIVKVSGRLARPWPDLSALRLPPATPLCLAATLAGSLLPDLFGILSGAAAASLVTAFAVVGLAVLHSLTRPIKNRMLVLAGMYAATLVLAWPVLLISVLGVAETIFNIRVRLGRLRRPPSLPT
jgi:hypothetical protein